MILKKVVFVFIILFCLTQAVFCSDFFISIKLTWELYIRAGIEYRISRYFGMKVNAGFTFYGLIGADAGVVFYFLPIESPWQLNILAGIPNISFVPVPSNPACMISFGASLLTGYSFTEKLMVYGRIGGGFPLFFEEDKEMIRDIGFPLGLWPDIAVGINIRL